MNDEIRKRLKWVLMYKETQNAGLTCLRCRISRPTLRKNGLLGLKKAESMAWRAKAGAPIHPQTAK